MTRTELLEHYLKQTDLTVKELIDRNAFAQIMQFAEAYHLEQLRIGVVSNNEVALKAFVEEYVEAWEDGMGGDTDLYRKAKSLL